MDSSTLKLVTYNVKHFKENKVNFCKELLSQCNILFLQEHCLYQSTLCDFFQLGNVSFHGTSAMNGDAPLVGRPHGGCAIVWSNLLKCKFTPVNTESDRICIVKMTLDNGSTVLLVNLYLPCDSHNRDAQFENTADILNTVSRIVNEQNCDMNVVGGDLNAHLTRNTPHVLAVKHFVNNNRLHIGLDHTLAEVDFTFHSLANKTNSLIDHFLLCDYLFANINCYAIIDSVDNMSDHVALLCSFDRQVLSHQLQERVYQPRAAWHKAGHNNIQDYQDVLDENLKKISLPIDALHCNDFNCSTECTHRLDLDKLLNDIVACCIVSEIECIPRTANKRKAGLPGWNDFVKGYHHEALYWHRLWQDAGKPQNGELANKMRQTRHAYHYAVRYCKRNCDVIAATKMGEALSSGQNRDFWKEIRTLKKSAKSIPSTVDNAENKQDIMHLFYRKFKDLFNATPLCKDVLENIMIELNTRIRTCNNHAHIVHAETVQKLVKQLKKGKYDGQIGFNSNCLVFGTKRLFSLLALYFSAAICHGYLSETLLVGTLCPIPKSNHLNNSDKYRAIALCSSITKLFELIFIEKQRPQLKSDPLQFGFKAKRSTSLCTLFMTGIANKFVNGGSAVYSCLLDMSKAFDRVDYGNLFRILLARNMDPLYVRSLMFMYLNQKLRIRWDDIYSPYFKVTSGVRQGGGVVSPTILHIC